MSGSSGFRDMHGEASPKGYVAMNEARFLLDLRAGVTTGVPSHGGTPEHQAAAMITDLEEQRKTANGRRRIAAAVMTHNLIGGVDAVRRIFDEKRQVVLDIGCRGTAPRMAEAIAAYLLPSGARPVTDAAGFEGTNEILIPVLRESKNLFSDTADIMVKVSSRHRERPLILCGEVGIPENMLGTYFEYVDASKISVSVLPGILEAVYGQDAVGQAGSGMIAFPEGMKISVVNVCLAATQKMPEDFCLHLAYNILKQRRDFSAEQKRPDPRQMESSLVASLPRPAPPAPPKITLDDIKGYGEAERIARTIAHDLTEHAAGRLAWRDAVSSAIFHGEPGTGKTWLARALANSVPGAEIHITSLAKITAAGGDRNGGNSVVAEMKKMFDKARNNRPAVIFIDEIDSFRKREGVSHNSYYNQFIVNALLDLMNAEDREGVVVLGACNDIDLVDPALKRDGRIDFIAEVMLPGEEAVRSILERNLPDGIAADGLLKHAMGRPASEIDGVLRKVKARARIDKRPVTQEDIEREFNPTGQDFSLNRKRTAIHECGHAIVAAAIGGRKVERIVVRAGGGGAAYILGGYGERLEGDLIEQIAVLMAGKAAEKEILGNYSAGIGGAPNSDLARATRLSIAMEARLGLLDEDATYFGGNDDDWLLAEKRPDIGKRIVEGERIAAAILTENRDLLMRMSEMLAKTQVFDEAEVRPWLEQVIPYRRDDTPKQI